MAQHQSNARTQGKFSLVRRKFCKRAPLDMGIYIDVLK